MKKLVLATNNEHKVTELNRMLKDLGFECVPLKSIGDFEEPVEDGDSFLENAKIKAKAAYDNCGLCVLADDS
ncbi:MAG: non-canonical purine NTP pyrophosphatase, partial [Coriobacteriales bacterium]|nr:non-canonical purine NTP pyrophosphatase [Coriobacteriales bacterium]